MDRFPNSQQSRSTPRRQPEQQLASARSEAHTQNSVSQHPVSYPGSEKRRTKYLKPLGIIVALVALAVLAAALYKFAGGASVTGVDKSKYQAVFLTNGQVYFGKLTTAGNYYKLSNVYYLQAKSSSEKSDNPQQATDGTGDVQLIKLGNEIHGPEDTMLIEKPQVLFIENLKNDGKVSDSINKYQKNQK